MSNSRRNPGTAWMALHTCHKHALSFGGVEPRQTAKQNTKTWLVTLCYNWIRAQRVESKRAERYLGPLFLGVRLLFRVAG